MALGQGIGVYEVIELGTLEVVDVLLRLVKRVYVDYKYKAVSVGRQTISIPKLRVQSPQVSLSSLEAFKLRGYVLVTEIE